MQSTLPSYRGTLDAVRTMVRQEGWRSLYAGLYPAMLGSCMCVVWHVGDTHFPHTCKPPFPNTTGISWSLYFYAYNAAKRRYRQRLDSQQLQPHQNMLSALEAGAIVCMVTNPIWVIKTRLQLQQQAALRASIHISPVVKAAPPVGQTARQVVPYAGFVDAVRSIARQEGLGGFYKGLGPSLLLVGGAWVWRKNTV